MGGHAAERGTPAYREAAELGRALARDGALVATGGGPGAMEAVEPRAPPGRAPRRRARRRGRTRSPRCPSFRPSVERVGDGGDWRCGRAGRATAASACRRGRTATSRPNVFAGAIAKYFQNAVREATLLRRCDGGIAFLPGAAGTVQELFQDACENYYAEPPMVAPMVLVGAEHWTTERAGVAPAHGPRERPGDGVAHPSWSAPSTRLPGCSGVTAERTGETRRYPPNRSRPPSCRVLASAGGLSRAVRST